MSAMNIEELHDKILVFHNAIADPVAFEKALSPGSPDIRQWSNWYHLGEQTHFVYYPDFKDEVFPTKSTWDQHFSAVSSPVAREAAEVFYTCTSEYVRRYSVNIPNWSHYSPFILTHSAKAMDGTLAMQYHTDFKMAETENPGYKFWITCLLYVNDDYEGGEIAFKVFERADNISENDPFIHLKYKPKAGDMLILPAHHPYYHGVCKTLSNRKLFLRMFWGYEYDGSPEWKANELKYGPEVWGEMEKARLAEEFKTSKWMMGAVEEKVNLDTNGARCEV
jgi:hypothetical protein